MKLLLYFSIFTTIIFAILLFTLLYAINQIDSTPISTNSEISTSIILAAFYFGLFLFFSITIAKSSGWVFIVLAIYGWVVFYCYQSEIYDESNLIIHIPIIILYLTILLGNYNSLMADKNKL